MLELADQNAEEEVLSRSYGQVRSTSLRAGAPNVRGCRSAALGTAARTVLVPVAFMSALGMSDYCRWSGILVLS